VIFRGSKSCLRVRSELRFASSLFAHATASAWLLKFRFTGSNPLRRIWTQYPCLRLVIVAKSFAHCDPFVIQSVSKSSRKLSTHRRQSIKNAAFAMIHRRLENGGRGKD
jgi:hypothetical protein